MPFLIGVLSQQSRPPAQQPVRTKSSVPPTRSWVDGRRFWWCSAWTWMQS